jgi:hypothetical protein
MVMVLKIRELLLQFSLVVIVHQSKYPKPMSGWTLNVFFNEPCTDQVPESLGTVGIARAIDEAVEPLEEIGINGDAKS